MAKIKKVKGFTLGELLVVLLLTTIVVGLSFTVLQLVQQQMFGISQNFERNTEYNLLNRSLWIDFNQSDGVWYDDKLQQLFCVNDYKTTVYTFESNLVLKEKDTFRLRVSQLDFFFNGDQRQQGEIDAVKFRVEKDSISREMFVYKTNAATSFLNE